MEKRREGWVERECGRETERERDLLYTRIKVERERELQPYYTQG